MSFQIQTKMRGEKTKVLGITIGRQVFRWIKFRGERDDEIFAEILLDLYEEKLNR